MKNRKLIFIGLFIFLSVVIGSFIYFPKSIDTALNRIKYPFEVGEILTSQQIDENLIMEASNPVPTPLLGHRCRSSQEITGSPTPFSTSNHYLWICESASFSLSNPNIAA